MDVAQQLLGSTLRAVAARQQQFFHTRLIEIHTLAIKALELT